MRYTEVTLHISPLEPFKDLLVYTLGEEGPYDSFVDIPDGVKAYVPTDQYDEAFLKNAVAEAGCTVTYEVKAMEDRNWNEEWERQHQPVLVESVADGRPFCWVRAPFHPHRDDVEYEIEIEPKMSFGTAHHATTYMMLSLLRGLPRKLTNVLGSPVILAEDPIHAVANGVGMTLQNLGEMKRILTTVHKSQL